jgi:SAM-dependent methyltransferase
VRHDPAADAVAGQFDRWRYPRPVEDLAAWLETRWEWFDPVHAHRILWPDRPYRADLDILIAGCGTNQAAVFAFTNPGARVVALDVSPSSLAHHRYLKERHGLANLELHRLPVEEAPGLGLDFDLVVSTGVLHCLADPVSGLAALAACARPDAALGLMVYATAGRQGVELLASAFRDMGLGQDEASVALVRRTLALLPDSHPVHRYLAIAPDLDCDAAVVDTFLPARDRSYTVPECLDLVTSAGLVFQSWFFNAPYHLHQPSSAPELAAAVEALPPAGQWSVVERLQPSNACHFFVACRPERPAATYAVDLSSPAALDYVPHLRQGCGLSGADLFRPDWATTLGPAQLALVEEVDGRRSIAEIVSRAADSRPQGDGPGDRAFALDLFGSLWRLDFLALGLGPGG